MANCRIGGTSPAPEGELAPEMLRALPPHLERRTSNLSGTRMSAVFSAVFFKSCHGRSEESSVVFREHHAIVRCEDPVKAFQAIVLRC